MPLTEAEELELLELEEAEYQASQKQKGPWAKVGPVTIEKNPADVDWLGVVKNEFTKEPPAGSTSVMDNPLLAVSAPAGAATAAGKGVLSAAEQIATSPLPGKIAKATDMVGRGKSLLGRLGKVLPEVMPKGAAGKVLNAATEVAGRRAAYSNALTGIPQGISDTARVVQAGQKGLAMALDKAPGIAAKLPLKEMASKLSPVAAGAVAYSAATKGPDKWAQDGLKKLGIHGEQAQRLLDSKEGKRLLIEASDLPPTAKRFKKIKEKIEQGAF